MSVHRPQPRLSTLDIRNRRDPGSLVVLTAYSAPMARLLDPHVDVLLVGDSLGMVLYGMPHTLAVSLDMMIAHGAAVVRGSQSACVVVDLPFASYQASPQQAFLSAARVLAESGAQAVKLEGGAEMAPTIAFLVERGIAVMAHVGLMPQKLNTLGGFKVQGKEEAGAAQVLRDAEAVAAAGAFSVVLEGVLEPLARQVCERLEIPVIGIGASPACAGQVLVTEDMLGLSGEQIPRFAEQYVRVDQLIGAAAERFAREVRGREFPQGRHCFGMPSGAA
ncbi:3-methyl-2-oxobutanoate hydroxymethyltransferase [Pseudomonas nitritireducens]|uniref:3-methyl-2-oxobutanoate hydroxymethyltransferase n=1 Tax=Pseudomonas nitroreducens TaxID=46680 RepID=A0A7W7P289_PSENT|nr:3-methyl-2-oxobutanoate hydroxymethyltransferase [Pseudomonas nitritireducens]MBB4864067.1 3-methyl-2-oxobutanoate hydroxymethyltransferase [Pseudomonas nitritireducens]